MPEVEYETDTLISAKHNRAASQKYYNQVMNTTNTTARPFVFTDLPVMLHRSPSGAKRRIRQRKGEPDVPPTAPPSLRACSSSTSSLSPAESSSSSSCQFDESNYRSLIDSGGYQSILPDFQPPPQPRVRTSISSSMSSLDIGSSANLAIYPQPSKPTVQVHPMPIDERSQSREDLAPRKEKPPVPSKPKGLLVDHISRSTSMSSIGYQNPTSHFLNNLIASPSLLSLQEAYQKNPHDTHLENRRIESISQVARRISTFEETKEDIDTDMSTNERRAQRLLEAVHKKNPLLASKIRRHLENNAELIRMETKLSYQMDKVLNHLKSANKREENDALLAESHIRRRLNDASVLRRTFDRRERDIDAAIANLLSEDEYRNWLIYKQTAAQLIRDDKQVTEKLVDSKTHLTILHSTR